MKSIGRINFPIFLFSIFILLSFAISLGHVDRWILSEQIAMAENMTKNDSLYPNLLKEDFSGVSVYPPGVAYLSLLLLTVNIDNFIFEVLLLSSVIFIVLFFAIQKRLVFQFFQMKISKEELLVYIILLSTLLPRWYDYSLQFKPGLIAYTIGFLLLSIFKGVDNKNSFGIFFLGIIFTIPLVFKQQYISFILGFLIYSFFNLNKKNILFSLGIILTIIFSVTALNFENFLFWSFEILQDDGFNSLLLIFSDHYLILLRLAFFIWFCFIVGIKFEINNFLLNGNLVESIKGNPLIPIIFFSFVINYLSFFKAGGNDGNIETALVFLSPLFLIIFKKINFKFLILFAFIGTFSLVPRAYNSIDNYIEMLNFKNSINTLELKNNIKIVTDSNSYFASRILLDDYQIQNYWTFSLLDKPVFKPNLFNYHNDNLLNVDFILLIEQSHPNRLFISDLDLNILYENKSGIIATNY